MSKDNKKNPQTLSTPLADNYCFVCGKDNPRGFKIAVSYFDEELAAETELSLAREFQGWADVIHGGILATMLDEMMAHAVWRFAGPGLTLSLEVRFHAPLKPGEQVRVRGATPTAAAAWPKAKSSAWPTAPASPRAKAASCCWKKPTPDLSHSAKCNPRSSHPVLYGRTQVSAPVLDALRGLPNQSCVA
jgi:hypothetical protein